MKKHIKHAILALGIAFAGSSHAKIDSERTMITRDNATFVVVNQTLQHYPELVELILNTQSADNALKQYYFDVLPSMQEETIDKLFNILQTEKRQLEELYAEYLEKTKQLNEKHLKESMAVGQGKK